MSQSTAGIPSFGPQKSLVKIGGALGIAAASIALLIFTVGCFGFHAVFTGLPVIPLILSAPGLVLVIVGATVKKSPGDEDTQVLAALFVNAIGLFAALLEMALWFNWSLFFQQGQPVG
jgi:hypothetical protein